MVERHRVPEHPKPGTVLANKYLVLHEIGSGGMGVVFAAKHRVTQKQIALKWLATPDTKAVERVLREASAAGQINHPNVVEVYDVVVDDGAVFIVMELLEGETLSSLLERGGPEDHELIALLIGAMHGVAAAHAASIIHRDIKPANIFLASAPNQTYGTPKVLDFGVSKLSDSDAPSLTSTGTVLGTPLYMSPEQLLASSSVDARTDVYAFGVILYEAMTGMQPYEAENAPQLIAKIQMTEPERPRRLRPAIPTALELTILKAMAKELEARHASMNELIAALEPFAQAAPLIDGTSPRRKTRTARLRRSPALPLEQPGARGRGLRWLTITSALALTSVVALTLVPSNSIRGTEQPVSRPSRPPIQSERPESQTALVQAEITPSPAATPQPPPTAPAPDVAHTKDTPESVRNLSNFGRSVARRDREVRKTAPADFITEERSHVSTNRIPVQASIGTTPPEQKPGPKPDQAVAPRKETATGTPPSTLNQDDPLMPSQTSRRDKKKLNILELRTWSKQE